MSRGPFRTIVADPPWPFEDKLPGKSRGAEKNYKVMRASQIKTFLGDTLLARGWCMAPDSRLFLWRVAAMSLEAFTVMSMWGFKHKAEIVWVKTTKTGKLHFGMGRQVRNCHETCLIGTCGKPERLSASVRSVLFAPYTRHSGKPDAFYDLVEQLSPGPYLELFGRRRRRGWAVLGDEVEDE